MRYFVTGASGWIGSAVVPQLQEAGHQVVGLARSDESAAALVSAGVEVRRGSLDDLDVLADAARDSDGVIHLAFKHDIAFTGDFAGAAAADRTAVEAFGGALAGSDRPLLIASGVLGLTTDSSAATEDDGHADAAREGLPAGPANRMATAEFVLGLADRGVRSSVLRLPPTVHGPGDSGFISTVVEIARNTGVSGYIGDGASRWPATHVLDVATIVRLAVEQASAGSTLHGVAEEGVSTLDIATVIARHLDVPLVSIDPADAPSHFTWLAHFLAADSPASSAQTRHRLGWQPTQIGLLADLDLGHYFQQPS